MSGLDHAEAETLRIAATSAFYSYHGMQPRGTSHGQSLREFRALQADRLRRARREIEAAENCIAWTDAELAAHDRRNDKDQA